MGLNAQRKKSIENERREVREGKVSEKVRVVGMRSRAPDVRKGSSLSDSGGHEEKVGASRMW